MKTVPREELYEQVWFKTMTKVAADYGVTGTALKKTCDRHRITTWVRQRLKQIDALISPHFLDISARSSKVDFAELDPQEEAERGSFYYSPPINLQLWSVDNAEGLATSCSPLEWTDALALPIEAAETG